MKKWFLYSIVVFIVLFTSGFLLAALNKPPNTDSSALTVENLENENIYDVSDENYNLEDYGKVVKDQPEITTEAKENVKIPAAYNCTFDSLESNKGALIEGSIFPVLKSYAEFYCMIDGHNLLLISREFENSKIAKDDFYLFTLSANADEELKIGEEVVFNKLGEMFVLFGPYVFQFVAIDENITDYEKFYKEKVAKFALQLVMENS